MMIRRAGEGIKRIIPSFCRSLSQSQSVTVETEYGPIKGDQRSSVLGKKYFNFQGIPYMKAPIGKLRFRDAQPPEKWLQPIDGTKGSPAYCMRSFLNYKDGGQEDAGVVNVYTPNVKPEKPIPVMVWIHGGGWNSGSGQTDLFGPDYLMQKDVLLVTMNYRLGPVGFLSLQDPDLGIPGNGGLKDQNFALKWVQRNIANFGGDPNNVTIFGESAGGASVHYHMISNASRNLFHKAIPMSGTTFCKVFSQIPPRDWSLRLAKELGYNGSASEKEVLEYLERPDGSTLVQAAKKVLTSHEEFAEHILYAFGATVEPYKSSNCLIPEDQILMARNAWSKDINCMMGGTSLEGILRANTDIDKIMEYMQYPKYYATAFELGVHENSEKAENYGRKLMDLYYKGTKPSVGNQQPYLKFISDLYFWHGIQRTIQSRLNCNGAGKNFLYRFDCNTELNFVKKLHQAKEMPGASHCDELPYLFKTCDSIVDFSKLGPKEMKMIDTMTSMWTNFAKTGKPVNDESQWKEVQLNETPLKCFNINQEQCNVISLPESDTLKVWNDIYKAENVEMF